MLTEDDVRRHMVNLSKLGGGPDVLRKAAARLLSSLDPVEATVLLRSVMRLSLERWEAAVVVLPALTRALALDGAEIPHAATLRQVANLHEHHDVELLFSEGEAPMSYDSAAAARADAKLFTRPLGYLKTQARLTRNPDELARFAVASNADVVREVLRNPRLTEEVVVRIAARRPARPEPLVEIWRSAKWSIRPAVRRALVMNPYLPPDVAAKIAPLLPKADLELVTADSALHPALREQARVLLDGLRP